MNETQTRQDSTNHSQNDHDYKPGENQDYSSIDNQSEETSVEEMKEKRPYSFWIACTKILVSIAFVTVVTFGLIRGIGIYLDGNELAGILIFIVVSITAFMGLALIMVFLNLAEDMMISRFTLEKIRDGTRFR